MHGVQVEVEEEPLDRLAVPVVHRQEEGEAPLRQPVVVEQQQHQLEAAGEPHCSTDPPGALQEVAAVELRRQLVVVEEELHHRLEVAEELHCSEGPLGALGEEVEEHAHQPAAVVERHLLGVVVEEPHCLRDHALGGLQEGEEELVHRLAVVVDGEHVHQQEAAGERR